MKKGPAGSYVLTRRDELTTGHDTAFVCGRVLVHFVHRIWQSEQEEIHGDRRLESNNA